MAWQRWQIEDYKVHVVTDKTRGYQDIHGFIRLSLAGADRATLWAWRAGVTPTLQNGSFPSGGGRHYYGRYRQEAFADLVDLLRNEAPVYFHYNDTTRGAWVATDPEPVGDGDGPALP